MELLNRHARALIWFFVRPLFHPPLEEISVEGILHALSDPVRAAIFMDIASADSARTCSAFNQVGQRSVAKSTLSQHFKVLREAGLIRSERKGVEMQNTSRCMEIDTRFPGLIPAIVDAHAVQANGPSARQPGEEPNGTLGGPSRTTSGEAERPT